MKKWQILFSMTVICFFLFGCQSTHENKDITTDSSTDTEAVADKDSPFIAYELGEGSDSEQTSFAEYSLWTGEQGMFHRDNAPEELEIEFDGKEYVGIYDYSSLVPFGNYVEDCYNIEKGRFVVKALTGDLRKIRFYECTPGKLKAEQLTEKAYEYARRFINPEKYTLEIKTRDSYLSYRFKRYLCNLDTCAFFNIALSTSGEIPILSCYMTDELEEAIDQLGEEEAEEKIARLTSAEAEAVAIEKINTNHPDNAGCAVKDRTVIVLENGDLGVAYSMIVSNKVTMKDTGEELIEESLIYVVLAEQE